ncbi:hypothetical protein NA57DRAFT_39008, partial [Rhizodiscina lignyota]
GRRRKIRCIYSSDNPSVCNECFARGSKCIDQEHAESDVVLDQRKNLRERVAKLETLVETLLDDKSDRTTAAEALKKLGGSEFPPTPRSNNESPRAPLTVPEREDLQRGAIDAPVLSLFDNAVLSRVESKLSTITSTSSPGISRSEETSPAEQRAWSISHEAEPTFDEVNKLKNDRIRQIFIKALPSWDELIKICRGNDAWWEMCKHKCSGIVGNIQSLENFATACLTEKGNPSKLGCLILCVGSCADDNGEALDRALELVDRYITSDDDYLSTLEGLECCMLQAKCYSDIGQARRSWRIFRRALNNAEMMGLHKTHSSSPQAAGIWWNLYMGDRMVSLMLGLPYAINNDHVDMRVNGKDIWEDKSIETFMLKSAIVAGYVTDRLLSSKSSSFSSAMEVDQLMDKIISDLPKEWWTIPPSSEIDTASKLVDWQVQVLTQMCFHQTRVYLHMPFMLQSATNSRYDYSRRACLDGAREMLNLYHVLRQAGFSAYQCKVIDFIGFTAAVVLILGLLGYGRLASSHDPQQDERDWQLIETSMEIFKEAANEKGGKVAEQSYQVLKQFSQVRNFEGQGPDDNPDCIAKISIPYFGTMSIKRGQKFHHIPTPNSSNTPSSMSNCQHTPASTTASSFQQSNSSNFPSPATQNTHNPFTQQQQQSISTASNNISSMDPFIAYDAGFYMPPGGMFDQFGQDEPLSNYMSPPTTNTNSNSASGRFPWGMASMDLDQDWSWFMNDVQNWQPSGSQGQGANSANGGHPQFAVLP